MKKPVALTTVLLSLLVVSSASAEASRTWVSGVGDDVNPCSRTAPCKTFAGAISKTQAGGEIDTLDPGGFGGVTITKAITINGSVSSGITSAGTFGITINASSNDVVVLRHLAINGITTGTNGIRFNTGKGLTLDDVSVRGGQNGLVVNGALAGPARISIRNSSFENNTLSGTNGGILLAPTSSFARLSMTGSSIVGNALGLSVQGTSSASVVDSVISDNVGNGAETAGSGRLTLTRTLLEGNGNYGIFAGTGSVIRSSDSTITGNGTGVGGTGSTLSRGNNTLEDNTADGSFSGSYSPK